jgi:hypothetical protein
MITDPETAREGVQNRIVLALLDYWNAVMKVVYEEPGMPGRGVSPYAAGDMHLTTYAFGCIL